MMKLEDALGAGPVVVGEYLSTKSDEVKYTSKTDGKSASFTRHYAFLLLGSGYPMACTFREPVQGFKKGEKVVVMVRGAEQSQGLVTVEGAAIHKLA